MTAAELADEVLLWSRMEHRPYVRDVSKFSTYGQMLMSLRAQIGITQTGLAHRIGVSPQAISAWERDKSEPCEVSRKKLMAILLLGDV
jgi:DNA-binding XRE family transcriptional regulator